MTAGERLLLLRAVHVEVEIPVVDFLVSAVGADRLQRGVEGVQQRGIVFAHPDAVADAEVFAVGQLGADKGEIFAAGRFENSLALTLASSDASSRPLARSSFTSCWLW